MRWILVLVGLCVSLQVTAQSHSTGWIFHSWTGSFSARALVRMDPAGRLTTLLPTQLQAPYGVCMDADNRTIVMAALDAAGGSTGLIWVDPATGAVVRRRAVAPRGDHWAQNVVLDSDGDYLVTMYNRFLRFTEIWHVPRSGAVTTFSSAGGSQPVIELDTGDLIFNSYWRLTTGTGFVSQDGQRAGFIATNAINAHYSQDYRTGDFFGPKFRGTIPSPTPHILRMTRQGGESTFLAGVDSAAVFADRTSASSPRFLFWQYQPAGLYALDVATKAITTVRANVSAYPIAAYRGRNVASVKRGAGQWGVNVSFPGQTGNRYVVALSITGYRPGLSISDGRYIPLVIDAVTRLGLQGLLRPILTGDTGVLDANDEAVAHLDVRGLPGVAGMRVWMIAVTLDARGIHTISDPWILLL